MSIYYSLAEETLNDIVERTQNFAIRQGYPNCVWYKSPIDNNQSSPSHESSFSKCSSYSAALSHDIISKNKETSRCTNCSKNLSCLDHCKPKSKFYLC